MKVLFIDSVHPILEQRLTDLKFICEHDYHSSREKLLSKMSNYDGVIIRSRTPVDKEFLDAASQLKFICLLYTSPSPRDRTRSRMPSSA